MCESTAFESCPLDAQRIIILKSLNHPLSLSLSYPYLVLKQVFLVINEELSLPYFYLNWFEEKCAHGTEFIWDIAPNCYLRAH